MYIQSTITFTSQYITYNTNLPKKYIHLHLLPSSHSHSLSDDVLIPMRVLGPARAFALAEQAPWRARVLVALAFASSTTKGVIDGVHSDTPDAWPAPEPPAPSRLT